MTVLANGEKVEEYVNDLMEIMLKTQAMKDTKSGRRGDNKELTKTRKVKSKEDRGDI